ncbi:hypothetical protein [Quadrisphaera sp. DSM 44207]|uniref:hypothetical protein n=1 Tax=Quadrisphaera sp. DSM 44207 TaxID=1881057 RepID=UPI00088DD545|nr:hypothetical protein [Quadrisphaera sp. DSM 44207]SDQ43229.1 hypothetical protein SAMN05428996_1680 [Quadrisphaera sp. DSM 44207]
MLDLPRSARLAAWGSAVLDGRARAADAVRAVVRDDEPHAVGGGADAGLDGVGGPFAAVLDVPDLLTALERAGARGLRVVLPAPGDPSGLPGPAAFNADALEAGEAVLVDGEVLLHAGPGHLGAVPAVEGFGSVLEPGTRVTWHLAATAPPRAPEATSLADAERSLRTALAEATRALADLDVARWREDAADRVAAVRDGGLPRDALPPGTDGRAARVAASAARVRAVVALAVEDDGAAVSGYEAVARARSLRDVDAVARRALAVAVNAARASPRAEPR